MKLLRVDFSSSVGFGHLKRSMVFMQRYKKGEYAIVCKECVDNIVKNIPVYSINSEEEFFELVRDLKPEEVIVDNYAFDYKNEKRFKEDFPHIKLICFDDLFWPHYCDEIINHNLYAKKDSYKGLPSFTKVRIIPPLIGDNFKKAKKIQVKKEGIFISFGATDTQGLGLKVLKLLKPYRPLVHFYTTSANAHLKELNKFTFLNRWVKLHIDEDVAEGMARAEFGIITPSVISYEALYMGLPFVAVEVAENQKFITSFLKRKRYGVFKKNQIKRVSKFIAL